TGWSCTDNYPDADYDTGNPYDYYYPALNVNLWMPVSTVSAFEIIAGVGIDELEDSKTGLNVYPNPTYDILYINTDNKEAVYTIYNNTGQLIQSDKFNNSINVSNLSTGIYLLNIQTKENTYNIKFIKE
ncbi:MAG: T9SS type A sorting domain-containing protein, partial [Bacteroidota bacterium]